MYSDVILEIPIKEENHFFIDSNIKKKRKIEEKSKNHKCQQCNYEAATKENLQKHIRTHTGEKPYKCQHCNYAATQKQHLVFHLQRHMKSNQRDRFRVFNLKDLGPRSGPIRGRFAAWI